MTANPLVTLGLPASADEAEIRRRYLQLVREFPPDRAPQRFAEIRAAYEQLKNPEEFLERLLFEQKSHDSPASFRESLRARLRGARMSVDSLLSLAERP